MVGNAQYILEQHEKADTAREYQIGAVVTAVVVKIMDDRCVVAYNGGYGYVMESCLSWHSVKNMHDFVNVGGEYEFMFLRRCPKGRAGNLSLRKPGDDDWNEIIQTMKDALYSNQILKARIVDITNKNRCYVELLNLNVRTILTIPGISDGLFEFKQFPEFKVGRELNVRVANIHGGSILDARSRIQLRVFPEQEFWINQ